jgi:hypothetical protein
MEWEGLDGPGRGADFPLGAIHRNQMWAWQIFENVIQTTFRKSDNRFRLPPRNCSWKVVLDFRNSGDKYVKLAKPVLVRSRIALLTGLPGLESPVGERNHCKEIGSMVKVFGLCV